MANRDDNDWALRNLIVTLGRHFIKEQLSMLKFLLYDTLELCDLTRGMAVDFFDKLNQCGKIKPEDVRLLTEIAELINVDYMNNLLSEYTTKVQQTDTDQCHGLSSERKALFKAIRAFDDKPNTDGGPTDVHNLNVYYSLAIHSFTNGWDLVFHVETYIWAKKLKARTKYIEDFASQINPRARQCLEPIMGRAATGGGDEDHTDSNPTSNNDENIDRRPTGTPSGSG